MGIKVIETGPELDPDEVKKAIDLRSFLAPGEAVSGNRPLVMFCRWHADTKTPNMYVYVDHVHCFACGKHADLFELLEQEHPGVSFPDIVKLAADGAGFTAPLVEFDRGGHARSTVAIEKPVKATAPPMDPELAEKFHRNLGDKRRWFSDRGLSDALIDSEKLGHNGRAFTIPVWARDGRLLTIRFRRDDSVSQKGPKYWGMEGFNDVLLFNAKALDFGGDTVFVCLPTGERLLTRKGLKTVEDIGPWSELFSFEGIWQKPASGIARWYSGEVVRLRPLTVPVSMRMTLNHRVMVIRGMKCVNRSWNMWCSPDCARRAKQDRVRVRCPEFSEPEWVPAEDVRAHDWLVSPVDGTSFDHAELEGRVLGPSLKRGEEIPRGILALPEFWRLIGYWFADGTEVCNGKQWGEITIYFSENETEWADDVQAIVSGVLCRTVGLTKRHGQVSPHFCSRQLVAWLRENFRDGGEKRLPEWMMLLPLHLQEQFVIGFWRGDGTYKMSRNEASIASVSLDALLLVQRMLWRLGIVTSVSRGRKGGPATFPNGKTYNAKDLWHLVGASAFCGLLGVGRGAKRKNRTKAVLQGRFIWLPVAEISREPYEGYVHNFVMRPHENYTGHGICLHNCEGELDSLKLWDECLPAVSATNGARAFNADLAAELWQFKWKVICYDSDEAGRENAARVAAFFPGSAKCLDLSPHKDVTDWFRENEIGEFLAKVETSGAAGVSAHWGSALRGGFWK